ncbi:hypothetical protein ABIB82_006687 [Bradyrhizobium sp. i1.8.4]
MVILNIFFLARSKAPGNGIAATPEPREREEPTRLEHWNIDVFLNECSIARRSPSQSHLENAKRLVTIGVHAIADAAKEVLRRVDG